MQPMWLCIFLGRQFEGTYENTQGWEKKCCQCEYACSESSSLRRYLKMHSHENSNKCNQCDFASALAFNLKTHLKTHSGEKSNKCSQCNFTSPYTSNLRQHLKIHSGEKSNKSNLWLCIYQGKHLENTFEKTQWKEIEHIMQPMWLCML